MLSIDEASPANTDFSDEFPFVTVSDMLVKRELNRRKERSSRARTSRRACSSSRVILVRKPPLFEEEDSLPVERQPMTS